MDKHSTVHCITNDRILEFLFVACSHVKLHSRCMMLLAADA